MLQLGWGSSGRKNVSKQVVMESDTDEIQLCCKVRQTVRGEYPHAKITYLVLFSGLAMLTVHLVRERTLHTSFCRNFQVSNVSRCDVTRQHSLVVFLQAVLVRAVDVAIITQSAVARVCVVTIFARTEPPSVCTVSSHPLAFNERSLSPIKSEGVTSCCRAVSNRTDAFATPTTH